MNDQKMLETLADKYGIDKTKQTWQVDLFNILCINTENGEKLEAERAKTRRLLESERFIMDCLKNKKLPMFNKKLKKLLKGKRLFADYKNNTINFS